jgi:hypothetical protein
VTVARNVDVTRKIWTIKLQNASIEGYKNRQATNPMATLGITANGTVEEEGDTFCVIPRRHIDERVSAL